MTGDPDRAADSQDAAETFDEENITRDGEDIATPDVARDVLDVTSAADDHLPDEAEGGDGEDFDPDQADEAELEFMLESDDGVDDDGAPATRDDADLVSGEEPETAEYEADRISDADLEELGYGAGKATSAARRRQERRLDEGLEETFPASDPVSINPGRG